MFSRDGSLLPSSYADARYIDTRHCFKGQGFELRYKAFLKKGNQAAGAPAPAPSGGVYGDASTYGDASPYGDGSGGVYGEDSNYGDASGGGGGGGGGGYGGESLYDTAAANGADDVYGGDAVYDAAGGPDDVYGGDALYDEAGTGGGGEPTYDAAQSGYLDTSPGPN